jgi:septal ring factor EnvC (AmiA/AmiB activator)
LLQRSSLVFLSLHTTFISFTTITANLLTTISYHLSPQLKVAENRELGFAQHKTDLEEKARFSRMLPVRQQLEAALIQQQKIAYDRMVLRIHSEALEDYRYGKVAKARYMLEEVNESRQQEEEEEQDRLKAEEEDRIAQENYERARMEREAMEALEREREIEAARVAKEKALAMEVIRAEAAEAHRIAVEAAAAKKALEPPVAERERERESTPDDEGDWKKSGPSGRVQVSVAKTGETPALWKPSRVSSLDTAFGGNSGAVRRPTFGASGGDGGSGGGYRGSRGNDAPAPTRGGSDWGG